ncbi:MAG TPA: LLM class flavin-dependent oxidoreductase [Dehalococcoidia bacterium]|nr:LLM class flavin-dependent oxidoreductase [Dehalococcoidia bacterium]
MQAPSGLKLGFVLPQASIDGPLDRALTVRVAQRAEALGYDDLWSIDQLTGRIPIFESLTLLSYIAAVTSQIRLGTAVIVTNLRNPVVFAKQVASLDHLCDGRLNLGIGLGTTTRTYPTFGMPEEHRVGRFLESLRVMKALWTEPRVTLEGRFWQLRNVPMEPKPLQKPHPPLWFGAHSPDAMRRAVRHGDAWMCAGSTPQTEVVGEIERIKATLAEEGRDATGFPLSKRLYFAIDNDEARARQRLREWIGTYYGNPDSADLWCIYGSIEKCADFIGTMREAGLTHLMLNPVFDYEEHLELVASDLAPRI